MPSSRTIADLESRGYTHAECICDGCGYTVQMPFNLIRRGRRSLAAKLGGMTLADLQPLLKCERCKPKRSPDRIAPWSRNDAYNRPSLTGRLPTRQEE